MPPFLNVVATEETAVHAAEVFGRLVLSAVFGLIVSWIYRKTRKSTDVVASFPTTLVLLCVLIAMVTQVIGDSVARAFSLVGALSIVRFRTVVRDTQDTAYVIFAVGVGMAAGAAAPLVGIIGLVVVGATAALMKRRENVIAGGQPPFLVHFRVSIGHDLETLQRGLDPFVQGRDLVSVETAKQGAALDVTYEVRMKNETSPSELMRALNKIEGVQSVELQKRTEEG